MGSPSRCGSTLAQRMLCSHVDAIAMQWTLLSNQRCATTYHQYEHHISTMPMSDLGHMTMTHVYISILRYILAHIQETHFRGAGVSISIIYYYFSIASYITETTIFYHTVKYLPVLHCARAKYSFLFIVLLDSFGSASLCRTFLFIRIFVIYCLVFV